MEATTPFEVRCPRCDVSFPTGTKRCVHCGGRTGPSAGRGAAPGDPIVGAQGQDVFIHAAEGDVVEPFGVEEETEGGRSGLDRSAVTLIWILLAVAFSVLRACSES